MVKTKSPKTRERNPRSSWTKEEKARERARQQRDERIRRMASGNGRNAAWSAGGTTAFPELERTEEERDYGRKTKYKSEREKMVEAQPSGQNVQTYTSTRDGKMSINGKNTQGAVTYTYTNRDMNGNFVSQTGRSQVANRKERSYDTRAGMNNISPRVIQAWLDNGMARVVGEGRMVDGDGNIIRQKRDGNFTMGLAVG